MTQVFHIVPATTRPGLSLLVLLVPLVVMGIVVSLVFASFLGAVGDVRDLGQGLDSPAILRRMIPASELVSARPRVMSHRASFVRRHEREAPRCRAIDPAGFAWRTVNGRFSI